MKIFITADWHIGKKLHNEDLEEDIQLFFHWLLNKIEQESPERLATSITQNLQEELVKLVKEKLRVIPINTPDQVLSIIIL